ncbi:MAG: hypothetical protein ACI9PU_001146, partial [Ascidiaceihabitans sp.]
RRTGNKPSIWDVPCDMAVSKSLSLVGGGCQLHHRAKQCHHLGNSYYARILSEISVPRR